MFIELIRPTGEGILYNVNTITKVYKHTEDSVHVYFSDGKDHFFDNTYEDVESVLIQRKIF